MTAPYRPEPGAGEAMYALATELYPICRSITGAGLRETLRRIQRLVSLELHEVASGTRVLDWTVPKEWNVRDAWVADARGERVIDFQRHNLHVLNYSVPVRRRMTLAELRPHLFTLPERPDWIPYRTSYYAENWGFCLAQRVLDALPEGEYEVCIDATLEPGHLTYGELFLPGAATDEMLFSCHVCHPSLANDNLAGVVVAVWLARNRACAARIRGGMTLVCLGDERGFTYKRTFAGRTQIDRAAELVLALARQEVLAVGQMARLEPRVDADLVLGIRE